MSHNTWIHRIVRKAVRPLVGTSVTPNHITTLRLLSGLAAAAALSEGTDTWRNAGAGIFLLSFFLDRADGELARQGGISTPLGHKYDLISDGVCNALAFFGLGIGLTAGFFGNWAIAMGIIASISVASVFWLVNRVEASKGERAAELSSKAGFDADDGMLALPILIWLGQADWLLMAACIGAPIFAAFMVIKMRDLVA